MAGRPERREAGFSSVHVHKRGMWRMGVHVPAGGSGQRAETCLELGKLLQRSVGRAGNV